MIFDPVAFSYKFVGILLAISAAFFVIGFFVPLILNKVSEIKLNSGEMTLAISIPAVVSSILQWIILSLSLFELKPFITLMIPLNWVLYIGVYFILKSKKNNPIQD